jgi:heme/copper-type cytochrome/quinol oxidase subunit 2
VGSRFRCFATSARLALALATFTICLMGRSAADDSSIDMTTSADTFTFSPDKIVAHVGVEQTLRFRSIAGVHGVGSTELHIATAIIRPNRITTVTFTPDQPGTFTAHCAYVCGVGHQGMAFTVDVQP